MVFVSGKLLCISFAPKNAFTFFVIKTHWASHKCSIHVRIVLGGRPCCKFSEMWKVHTTRYSVIFQKFPSRVRVGQKNPSSIRVQGTRWTLFRRYLFQIFLLFLIHLDILDIDKRSFWRCLWSERAVKVFQAGTSRVHLWFILQPPTTQSSCTNINIITIKDKEEEEGRPTNFFSHSVLHHSASCHNSHTGWQKKCMCSVSQDFDFQPVW